MARDVEFLNIGSVKASKALGEKVTRQLRKSELGMNIKLYMPGTTLVVSKDACIDIRFGNREKDADFVVGQVSLYLGNAAMKKGTSKDDIAGLRDLGEGRDFDYDLRLQIYFSKDEKETLQLKHEDMIIVNFKPHDKSPDFVVASASLIIKE